MLEENIEKTAYISLQSRLSDYAMRCRPSNIDSALRGLPFTFIYIDDILIASKDNAEHIEHLCIVFQHLQKYGFTINPKKCVFRLSSVQFLSYKVHTSGIKPYLIKFQ